MSLILVLLDGSVYTSSDSFRKWQSTPVLHDEKLRKFTESLYQIDPVSFWLESERDGVWINQFVPAGKGIAVRSTPPLPFPSREIHSVGRSGRTIVASTFSEGVSILRCDDGKTWKVVVRGLNYWFYAPLDLTEQFLCAITTRRVGGKIEGTYIKVFRIGGSNLQEIYTEKVPGDIGTFVPAEWGWFMCSNLDGKYRTYKVHTSKRKPSSLEYYGRGIPIGPAIGKDVALYDDPKGGFDLFYKKKPTGVVPAIYRTDFEAVPYHLPGIGCGYLSNKKRGVYINKTLHPHPGFYQYATLFFLPPATGA